MKWIQKSEEPEALRNWKEQANADWTPTWDVLRASEKEGVHDSLLREQGYICCYCGQRISTKTSHIEHLKPRTRYPELALEYSNMLASCQGESETPPPLPVHCGHKKKSWYDEKLMVSPLDKNCGDFFTYTESGEISPGANPETKAAAETTINKIGLNIDKLIALRKKALEAILDDWESLTDEDKKTLMSGFEQRNSAGAYEPFCAAIIYMINQLLP